ncbi:MAG: hypothetical protein Q8Q02_06340 [Nocardioides sp.]|nr:hypothetical protein [Nocardioides sp.]
MTIEATGERPMTREEIVALADAVIPYDGVASGIGSTTYGVQILIEASSREEATELAKVVFAEVVAKSGLPDWPVSRLELLTEAEELDDIQPVITHERHEP